MVRAKISCNTLIKNTSIIILLNLFHFSLFTFHLSIASAMRLASASVWIYTS